MNVGTGDRDGDWDRGRNMQARYVQVKSLHAFGNEVQEAACILVRADSGDLSTSTMLDSLGSLGSALLHAVLCQNVDQGHKVDFLLSTSYTQNKFK